MSRNIAPIILTAATVLLSAVAPALAQRGGGSVPKVGTMLPTVAAVDDQGNEFSTASLRGSYSVLVFGCLT